MVQNPELWVNCFHWKGIYKGLLKISNLKESLIILLFSFLTVTRHSITVVVLSVVITWKKTSLFMIKIIFYKWICDVKTKTTYLLRSSEAKQVGGYRYSRALVKVSTLNYSGAIKSLNQLCNSFDKRPIEIVHLFLSHHIETSAHCEIY